MYTERINQLKAFNDLEYYIEVDDVEKMVNCISSLNYDINIRFLKNMTPLMLAVKHNSQLVLDYLLTHGADLSLKNDMGKDALQLAMDQITKTKLQRYIHLRDLDKSLFWQ